MSADQPTPTTGRDATERAGRAAGRMAAVIFLAFVSGIVQGFLAGLLGGPTWFFGMLGAAAWILTAARTPVLAYALIRFTVAAWIFLLGWSMASGGAGPALIAAAGAAYAAVVMLAARRQDRRDAARSVPALTAIYATRLLGHDGDRNDTEKVVAAAVYRTIAELADDGRLGGTK